MRLVVTKSLESGVRLGKTIYNDNGQVLINKGVALSNRMIGRLLELGISFVYIEDDKSEGIEMVDSVSLESRNRAITSIKKEFTMIADTMKLSKSFNTNLLQKKFSSVIKDILDDIKNNRDALSFLSDVYSYDSYIFTHSLNVTIYTLGLALEMNFNEKQLMEIGLGAILHDVGKLAIPTEILEKPGRLTNEEFEVIKDHTTAGFNLLRDSGSFPLLTAHCAFQHHERIDGSGYPRGLKGGDIHTYAKLIGLADVFDAVTSNRVYRGAMLPHEGLDLIYSGVDTLFELELVEAFSKTVAVYPVGLMVWLNDGRKGIVAKQNKAISTRPVIRIIEEENNEVASPYEIDLVKELNVTITDCESRLASKATL